MSEAVKTIKEPDWRYQEACIYIQESQNAKSAISTPADAIVQLLIRGIKGLLHLHKDCTPSVRQFTKAAWPVVTKVLYLGTLAKNSITTNLLNACLMRKLSYEQASKTGFPYERAVYMLYNKAFFDVENLLDYSCLKSDYLLDKNRLDSRSLCVRLLTSLGTDTDGLNMGQGSLLSDSESHLIRKIMQSYRQKQIFKYVLEDKTLPAEIKANFMESAIKADEDRSFQLTLKEEETKGSESLEELAAHIEEGIRAFTQKEVQQVPADGSDSTNQYIHTNISQS